MNKKYLFLTLTICLMVFFIGVFILEKKNSASSFKMVVIPSEDSLEQINHLKPFVEHIESCTGVSISVVVADDYSAAIQSLKFKHSDIAWLGPFSYVLATKQASVEPIVGGVRKSTGKATYNSIIMTRKDSGINSIEDLHNKSFAFIDPASTSGYLMPTAMLKKKNIDPESYFSDVIYAGSHAAAGMAVMNKTVVAAADSLPSFHRLSKLKKINPEEIKILWTSDDIPPSPIIVRSEIPIKIKQALKRCILNYDSGVVSFEGALSGFVQVEDKDYNIIRETMELLNLKEPL